MLKKLEMALKDVLQYIQEARVYWKFVILRSTQNHI